MANPAYTELASKMELPDLLRQAEHVRALDEHPGWKLVLASIEQWEQKTLQRLLNETTKPEDIGRLRGVLLGLASAREAAETILDTARRREDEANRALMAQEQANV